jgi:hypothetical protein
MINLSIHIKTPPKKPSVAQRGTSGAQSSRASSTSFFFLSEKKQERPRKKGWFINVPQKIGCAHQIFLD